MDMVASMTRGARVPAANLHAMHRVTIEINGEGVPGVLAVPDSGSGPAVIVIQEWWGLVPHIADLVERFAAEGFVALAIDHYRGKTTTEPDEAQKLMLGVRIPQIMDDLSAAANWLVARPEVVGDDVRVVGFCMGGGLALLGPTANPKITCAVAFYPATPWPDYSPNWSAYSGRCAIVHKAASDEEHAGPMIAAAAAAIKAAGGSLVAYEYPGTQHAFFNDTRPEVFDPAASELAWERTLAAFRDDSCC